MGGGRILGKVIEMTKIPQKFPLPFYPVLPLLLQILQGAEGGGESPEYASGIGHWTNLLDGKLDRFIIWDGWFVTTHKWGGSGSKFYTFSGVSGSKTDNYKPGVLRLCGSKSGSLSVWNVIILLCGSETPITIKPGLLRFCPEDLDLDLDQSGLWSLRPSEQNLYPYQTGFLYFC